ncbi:MAG TPA: ABC transporter permease [Saprospiraceae bacterium]|jgi:ABC-2 type transport system permease protein|nr:ABC transporter permease [Saprospiraceae bacterium]HRO09737.1 ABC transporter permease [Saprospiraceae bacterium]HRO72903.1 ABC transporter permease [Saprospiraceae bacterium]HRP42982.1 ABC transporter permease [Saprospiraceae bacterium]
MHKIWLVIQREYLTRVKNKTFLMTTFLTPLGILLFIGIASLIMTTGSDKVKNIEVYDPTHLLGGELTTRDNLKLTFSELPMDSLIQHYIAGTTNGILEIPALSDSLATKYAYKFHSDDQLAMDESMSIEKAISKKIRAFKLQKLNVNDSLLTKLDTDITGVPVTILKDKKVTSMTTMVASALGFIIGYAMFFIILLYGMQVMRSVMEEKINRIVEVLISSVKPFELMLGKVIGVGLVGLTQIGIWLLLIPIVYYVAIAAFGIDMNAIQSIQTGNLPADMSALPPENEMAQILFELTNLNWIVILPLTLFYFLMGYFAYSALFAAIGSAIGEDVNEANSLTLPVMMPLMLAMYIGFSAFNAPDSNLAVWASMIPLLSSVVMPVRLPFDPPWWQIAVSVISLIIFTIFLVWLAARIYRVGILLYGKKASFKEIVKWIRYKG